MLGTLKKCYTSFKNMLQNSPHQDKVSIVGIHTFRAYDMTSPEAQALEQAIKNHIEQKSLWNAVAHRAHYLVLKEQLNKYFLREKVVKNLITTVGRSVLAQRLAVTTTFTGVINYGALGTGSTTPTNADTQLQTEVFRITVASSSFTTNTAFLDFFYTKASTNGTYNEFGTFIDGSGTANSGQMFTHALTGGWTKSSSESMTVSTQYAIN